MAFSRLRVNLPWPLLHPYDLAYGGTYYLVYGAWFAVGAVLGLFPVGGMEAFRSDPAALTRFFVWGRLLTALLGTASVYLVIRVGRLCGLGRTSALVSAASLACMPHPVQHGHYLTVHVLSTCAALLFLESLLRATTSAEPRSIPIAGLAAGAFASCEYTFLSCEYTFLSALPILGLFLWRARGWREALRAVAVAATVFAALNPGLWLDFAGWRAALKGQSHFISFFGAGPARLTRSLIPAAGATTLAVGTAGCVLLGRRGRGAAVLWGLLHLIALLSVGSAFARRYATLFPLLALGVGAWWEWGRPRAAVAVLLAVLFVEAGLRSGAVLRSFSFDDTRSEATAWCAANVPAGAAVGLENWFFAPHLDDERWRIVQGASDVVAADTRPAWYVSTEFNWEDRAALLTAGYRPVAAFRRPHRLGPITFDDGAWPEDMRYVNPTIRVWRRDIE